ncbi:hypothetical protein D3C85_379770 [compost metagenome]
MSDSNSVLRPVGKVICEAMVATGGTIGIAQVNLSLAPVGCELYVQPKDSRLKLEVEVANDNALHWQEGLRKANTRNSEVRSELRRCQELLRRVHSLVNQNNVDPRTLAIGEELGGLMESIRKELERTNAT